MFFLAGVYFLALSKQRWERLVGKLVSISDIEMSTTSFITIKVVGAILLGVSLFCIYRFFIYDPNAQLEHEFMQSARYHFEFSNLGHTGLDYFQSKKLPA